MTARPDAPPPDAHRICDYEGSPYRRVFWEAADRSFEDAAERLAVRALLPPQGERLLDIGAGFGRLVDLYHGYPDVYLLDYAHSMLADARSRHGPRCTYVCADLYRLPFATGAMDAAVQVRVLHHVESVPQALAEVARILRPGGAFVLEFANKRHLKAIARYAIGRQAEPPRRMAPHEFAPLNWNFHPAYVEGALRQAGLAIERRRAVSHFRLGALKRLLPARLLARVDAAIGAPLGRLALAPSQFVRARQASAPDAAPHDHVRGAALWRCPACGAEPLARVGQAVPCTSCGRAWPVVDGIHVFREGALQDP